jgi:hypothetical protein
MPLTSTSLRSMPLRSLAFSSSRETPTHALSNAVSSREWTMTLMSASESEHKATPATTVAHAADPDQRSDVRIAELVARAVCDVPGVVGLSPGHDVTAATHGPGKAVVGVVVHHRANDSLEIEVHVVVAESDVGSMLASLHTDATAPHASQTALLPALAEKIRSHIARALQDAEVGAPTSVDVYFDDLR